MAREFSTDNARRLIYEYTQINKDIKDVTESFTHLKKLVDENAAAVNSSQVVEGLKLDQIKTARYDSYPQPNEKSLIQSALQYLQVEEQEKVINIISNEYRELTTSKLRTLRDSTSSIKWFFSNKATKSLMNQTYAELRDNAVQYRLILQNCQDSLSQNNVISLDVAYARIPEQKEDIMRVISKCSPAATDKKIPAEIENLLHKYNDVISLLKRTEAEYGATLKKHKQQVLKSIQKATAEQIVKDLDNYDVDTLAQVRSGIRIKALRDNHYDTVGKIYSAPVYSLSSIYGISPESAWIIKEAAEEIAANVRKNAKLKISTDDRSPQLTGLLVSLFTYDNYRRAITVSVNAVNEFLRVLKADPGNLSNLPSNVEWIFQDSQAKEQFHASYTSLRQILETGFEEAVKQLVHAANRNIVPNPDYVWGDFERRSFDYFNLIEEIAPGILGNNDSLYGLPEDLAKEIQDESFFPNGLKVTLRRYQEWGVKYILHQRRALLGDEMGLGKTVQAIATMVSLRNTGATHFMVICPASVLPNWYKEVSTKSHLTAINVYGNYREYAFREWIQKGGVAITTYETTKIIQFPDDYSFDLLVVDEAHFIKNINAARSQHVRRIAAYTNRLLFMTGTALENKVDEMLSLIDVLQPDIAYKAQSVAYMSQAPQFREMIAPVYYRRKREDVLTELPAITEIKEWCSLFPQERDQYKRAVRANDRTAIRQVSWNIHDLNQSSKANRLRELVEEAEDDGRKILVFSFYLDTIQRVRELLGSRCTAPINGSVPVERRQEIIDQFEKMPAGSVLPAQIQAGGTGLNIQAASVVIICEPQLKPSIENQAISRAYRMGQTRKVLVYRLLAENTIDERIDDMLTEKQAVFDAFADVSAAAAATQKEEQQIDDKTFGKLIQEEIDRINAEEGNDTVIQNPEFVPPRQKTPSANRKQKAESDNPNMNYEAAQETKVNQSIPALTDVIRNDNSENEAEKNTYPSTPRRTRRARRVEQLSMQEPSEDQSESPLLEKPNDPIHFQSIDDLIILLQSMNVPCKDNRPKGGSLWMMSTPPSDSILQNAIVLNADQIELKPVRTDKCKAFNGTPGWYI